MVIIGFVRDGMGIAKGYIETVIYESDGYEGFEYTPYPGTLNLEYINICCRQYIINKRNEIKQLPCKVDKFGKRYYEFKYKGHTLYLNVYKQHVELVAEFNLREKFGWKTGDLIRLVGDENE